MIKVSNLNKYYNKNKTNEIHVINDVTLELPSHGLISFLGASGSGKTTLLNIIGGLDKAQGTISYDFFEMNKYEMSKIDKYRNENFGYVFQSYNLLLNETVYDNLKIALELINIYDAKETQNRIEYALKSVGMYKYRNKKASQLSGGQQQRIAIARALIKHCKVIIADEPTGNLDSANAIEVMNILKSISKKTLVLLVTHNEQLANFYSNYIYKIEDGKIINQYENISNDVLNTKNDNFIYLKDMNLTSGNIEGVGIKFYSNDQKDIELEIVERNNTFYIRSNKNIKLLDNSNIKLINDHYKPVEKSEINNYSYDDSFFNNSVKNKNIFSDFITNIKHSFINFIKPTKKIKIIYTSLALIGVLFAICAVSISNAVKVDTSNINADLNYSTLSSGNIWYQEDSEELQNNIINGNISSLQVLTERYLDFSYKINYVETITYSESFKRIYFNENVNKVLYGRAPIGNEVAISLAVADVLLEEFSSCCNSYEDLFNLSIDYDGSKLVGIVDGKNKMSYISEEEYVKTITSHIHINDNRIRYFEIEKKYDTYEVILGRDLTKDDLNTDKILISDKFTGYENLVNTDLPGIGFVVGVYRLKDNIEYYSDEIISNQNYKEELLNVYKYSYNVEDYVLIEGRNPEKENECLISTYNSKQIGDTINGYKIVGRYNANTQLLKAGVLFSTSALSVQDYTKKIFIIENEEGISATINNSKLNLKTLYQDEYDTIKETNTRKMTVFGLLGIVCLIAVSIMVFFLMRSKMINDIYNIGVYRSLGSSKLKIYLKYFCDIIIMVSFTTLITYIVIIFCYLTAIESINDYYNSELFSKGLGIPLLGIIIIYLINILFGLLPIFTLLRKTPSEILVKYDI